MGDLNTCPSPQTFGAATRRQLKKQNIPRYFIAVLQNNFNHYYQLVRLDT